MEQLRRELIEKDLIIESLSHNQKVLKTSLQQSERVVDELRSGLQGKEEQIGKLKREVEVYRKRCEDQDKMGGRGKMDKLEESNRQLKQQVTAMNEEHTKMKKQNAECLAKVKILNQLNQ